MKLTNKQIEEITTGAVSAKYLDDGISFCKVTDRQVGVWDKEKAILGERARTTSGIRLDFHTDSETFGVTLVRGGKFELLINGLIYKKYGNGEVSVKLPKGDTRVTLAFPSHDFGVIDNVTLDDGAYITKHTYDTKILFMGDSITQGWNSQYDTMSYAWQTTLYMNADSVINGIGGSYFLPDSFDKSDFDPDTVIVAYGTNDFGHFKTLDTLREMTAGFLDRVKEAYGDKRVICISPIWREDELKAKEMGDFVCCRDVVKQEITARGFELVDGYDIVPHEMDFYADALHPNDLGFSCYARNLVKYLTKGSL